MTFWLACLVSASGLAAWADRTSSRQRKQESERQNSYYEALRAIERAQWNNEEVR
jgi:hypothetical protein